VKDTHSLELLWPMPEQQSSYIAKPAGYLSHLFGYEGAGSVLSLLKVLRAIVVGFRLSYGVLQY
jgi:insulysin